MRRREREVVTRTKIEIMDDLTGEPGAQTFAFSLGSTGYEIDLVNPKLLTDALAPFIKVAHRPSRRGLPVPRPVPAHDNAAVRAWAREQGMKVSARGRVPFAVVSAYEAAH